MTVQREILTNSSSNYAVGDLSWFPTELDNKESLYDTSNNAISVISGKLSVKDTSVKVYDNTNFPEKGIIRINDELIYYSLKEDGFFKELIRGFNNSNIMTHSSGSLVLGCVSSLHHNSVRDAIIKSEQKTGLISDLPDIEGTLTSRVKFLDIKWFSPTARFFALPRYGRSPMTVNFRNFSLGEPYIEYYWEFGDPTSPDNFSNEIHPVHEYKKPGFYTVTLQVRGSDGRNSSFSKNEYIKVFDNNTVYEVLAYARIPAGFPGEYSTLKLDSAGRPLYDNRLPLTVEFVDQTLGLISERKWSFGDGVVELSDVNPYDHIISHTYSEPGVYWPELQVLDQNGIARAYKFRQPIIVGVEQRAEYTDIVYGQINSKNSLKKVSIGENYNKKVVIDSNSKALII